MSVWKLSIVALVTLVVACSGGRREPVQPVAAKPDANPQHVVTVDAAPEPDIVGVALSVTPSTALVSIDDVERGPASSLGVVPLEPGVHYVVITQDGYKPYRVEFVVTDKTERMTVRLEPGR